jgi:hypothetical protein
MRYYLSPCVRFVQSPPKLAVSTPSLTPFCLLRLDLSWVSVLASLKFDLPPFESSTNQRASPTSSLASLLPITASRSTCWFSRDRTWISRTSSSPPPPLLVLLIFGLRIVFLVFILFFYMYCRSLCVFTFYLTQFYWASNSLFLKKIPIPLFRLLVYSVSLETG